MLCWYYPNLRIRATHYYMSEPGPTLGLCLRGCVCSWLFLEESPRLPLLLVDLFSHAETLIGELAAKLGKGESRRMSTSAACPPHSHHWLWPQSRAGSGCTTVPDISSPTALTCLPPLDSGATSLWRTSKSVLGFEDKGTSRALQRHLGFCSQNSKDSTSFSNTGLWLRRMGLIFIIFLKIYFFLLGRERDLPFADLLPE